MTREDFLEALFALSSEELAGGLPPELQAAVEAQPDLAAELAALRLMDEALPAMGRAPVSEGFFEAQEQRIMAAVAAQGAASVAAQPESWKAPAGSLVVLVAVVGAYVCAGLEGTLLGGGGAEVAYSMAGSDPLMVFGMFYLGIFGLGVRSLQLDAAAEPVPARVGTGR